MIDREQFVKICKQCIKNTRSNVTPTNQFSGYRKYHKEIKENKLLTLSRDYLKKNAPLYKESRCLLFMHTTIKHVKLGQCGEMAYYLCVELLKNLKEAKGDAKISIVSSTLVDHVYLKINILLKNEKSISTWQVDAWKPAIIDVSPTPDGNIKNSESLIYGEYPSIFQEFETKLFENATPDFKIELPQAEEGLGRCPTPPPEIFSRNPMLHRDYTIEQAEAEGRLISEKNELGGLQKASHWQKQDQAEEKETSKNKSLGSR